MPASLLYTGELFKKSLTYAHSLDPDEILILSAKYGVVRLTDEIDPYEKTLNSMGVSERRSWARSTQEKLRQITDFEHDRFTILAGKRYRERLIRHLSHVDIPLEGLGIGKQLQWLKERCSDE